MVPWNLSFTVDDYLSLISVDGVGLCTRDANFGVSLWTAGWSVFLPHRSIWSYRWHVRADINQISDYVPPDSFWYGKETIFEMSYLRWRDGQPDNPLTNEICVSMWPQKSYRWSNDLCDKKLCFVCEDRSA